MGKPYMLQAGVSPVTCLWAFPKPPVEHGGGNHCEGVLSSLWSKLCLPSSGLSSAPGTTGKKETIQVLYQSIKTFLLIALFSDFPPRQDRFGCFSSVKTWPWRYSGWKLALWNEGLWHGVKGSDAEKVAENMLRFSETFSWLEYWRIHRCSRSLWSADCTDMFGFRCDWLDIPLALLITRIKKTCSGYLRKRLGLICHGHFNRLIGYSREQVQPPLFNGCRKAQNSLRPRSQCPQTQWSAALGKMGCSLKVLVWGKLGKCFAWVCPGWVILVPCLIPVDGVSVWHHSYKITNGNTDISAKILTQGSVIMKKPGFMFTVPSLTSSFLKLGGPSDSIIYIGLRKALLRWHSWRQVELAFLPLSDIRGWFLPFRNVCCIPTMCHFSLVGILWVNTVTSTQIRNSVLIELTHSLIVRSNLIDLSKMVENRPHTFWSWNHIRTSFF